MRCGVELSADHGGCYTDIFPTGYYAVMSSLMYVYRCRHSESHYGNPVSCEHCLLHCAFVKQDHVREKVSESCDAIF